jgi:hypothetical protein
MEGNDVGRGANSGQRLLSAGRRQGI